MRKWLVLYKNGQKEQFQADAYNGDTGVFRNAGSNVAWVNPSEVRSVREIAQREKAVKQDGEFVSR